MSWRRCEAPAVHRDRIAMVVAGSCIIFGCTTSHPPTATVEQSEPAGSDKSVTVSPLAGEDAMNPNPLEPRFVKLNVKGPSAVAFHPDRETILVVSDEGYVAELNEGLEQIERYKTKGDLEGIAVHPGTGRVYLASEREGAILELDLENSRVVRTLVIDFESHSALKSGSKKNKGIEGLAFVPSAGSQHRLFAVLQANPARLLELSEVAGDDATLSKKMRKRVRDRFESSKKRHGEMGAVHVENVVELKLKPLSDVVFAPDLDALVVLSSEKKIALMFDPETESVLGRFRLPGKKPEGLAFLPDGVLLVVDDDGGAWWIDDAKRWIAENSM